MSFQIAINSQKQKNFTDTDEFTRTNKFTGTDDFTGTKEFTKSNALDFRKYSKMIYCWIIKLYLKNDDIRSTLYFIFYLIEIKLFIAWFSGNSSSLAWEKQTKSAKLNTKWSLLIYFLNGFTWIQVNGNNTY